MCIAVDPFWLLLRDQVEVCMHPLVVCSLPAVTDPLFPMLTPGAAVY